MNGIRKEWSGLNVKIDKTREKGIIKEFVNDKFLIVINGIEKDFNRNEFTVLKIKEVKK